VHTDSFQDLGQHQIVTEGVDIVANLGGDTQFLFEIPLRIQSLSGETFTGGIVAVWLDMHAADDNKAAFGYALFNFLEHFGCEFLYPLEDGSGGTDKNEIGEFLHPVQGGSDGCFGFGTAFLPAPLPNGIQVGIAYHVKRGFLFHKRFSF
jgi:hypothetical protein